jgi:tetratricopeptide (TPR) repeat protein
MLLVSDLLRQNIALQHTEIPENVEKARENFTVLLDEAPGSPEILFQLATCYLMQQRYGLAAELFHRVIDHWPDRAEVWSNLGCCYRMQHDQERARWAFLKSLQYEERAETLNNLASSYINEANPEGGLAYAERALALDPAHAKPVWNEALLRLEQQDWSAFSGYEAGFECGERMMRSYSVQTPDPLPWWNGEPDKHVVMFDEQGIGDRLLAAGMLNNLPEQLKVVLECHPRLEAIYKRSFPQLEAVYPTVKTEKLEWPLEYKFDAKIATMSLAKLYWTAQQFITTPYLVPNSDLVAEYRKWYETLGPPPYITTTWAGGAPKTNTKYRTLKLSWLGPLIREGGTWLSMQYHSWAKTKVDKFRNETFLPIYHCAAAQEENYDHTLAALAASDFCVTACNSVVHTCGGGGIPCVVLVPKQRAWRYPAGDHFPWYGEHIAMLHQTENGDWAEVIERLRISLRELNDEAA